MKRNLLKGEQRKGSGLSVIVQTVLCCCLACFLWGISLAGDDHSAASVISLDASQARVKGKGVGLREGYIRDWKGKGSGVEWKVRVEEPGTYYLFLEYASPSSEGGELDIIVNGERRTSAKVPDTAGWDDFRAGCFASFHLDKGDQAIKLVAGRLNRTYLMDIRSGILSTEEDAASVERLVREQEEKARAMVSTDLDFASTLAAIRQNLPRLVSSRSRESVIRAFKERFPHQCVWLEQDSGNRFESFLYGRDGVDAEDLMAGLEWTSPDSGKVRDEVEKLQNNREKGGEDAWLRVYEQLAWERRMARLDKIRQRGGEVIFAKHHVFGSVSGIYLITETEGSSFPSSLCLLDLRNEKPGQFAKPSVLFDPGEGMVRDPELSYDANRLLFAMRPTRKNFVSTFSDRATGIPEMNYQIYEMNLADKSVRSLTDGKTYGSSFEPCYLPNGDIMFSSARIVQHITCGWGDHSNLFLMDKDGKYARRVGFDQTNTAFPVVLNDGRVVFTRRDYNDRGQSSAHALFVMNSDGTAQTELYGNQTGLPNSFHHARPIPGSRKLITIIGGYHTTQGGKLAILDPGAGTEKDEGLIELPGYRKPLVGDGYDDRYGKQGVQYSNPYALTEKDYLVSIASKNARDVPYGLYYMNDMGERELLAADPGVSCLQGILKAPRTKPGLRPSSVDYTKHEGVFYVQNVYFGEAARGIKPGTAKKLRVIEILYKNSTIGTSKGTGPGGCWDTVTPSGHGLATFDSKRVLGEATVYEDGSAKFLCDARKPVYFQLLDEEGRVIQTMRSWTVLMPGENFSCVGCHERKRDAPPAGSGRTIAQGKAAEQLVPFYGEPRAFSYISEVQPVFDRHCISCHCEGGKASNLVLTAEPFVDDKVAKKRFYRSYFNLTSARPGNGHQPSEFGFYPGDPVWGNRLKGKTLPDEPNRYVSWYTRFELMKPYPPYRAGSIRSGLVRTLEKGHKGVKLSREEMDKIRAWIDLNIPFAGEYDESNLWSDKEKKLYRERSAERLRNEQIEQENIAGFIRAGQPS